MKKVLILVLMAFICHLSKAQISSQYVRYLRVFDSVRIGDKTIYIIDADTSLSNNSDNALATQKALKNYIDKKIKGLGGDVFKDSTNEFTNTNKFDNSIYFLERWRINPSGSASFATNKFWIDSLGKTNLQLLQLPSQSTTPSVPAAGTLVVFSDGSGRFSWINALGYSRTFHSGSLTGNRLYKLYDKDYTLADSADVVLKLNISDSGLYYYPYKSNPKRYTKSDSIAASLITSTTNMTVTNGTNRLFGINNLSIDYSPNLLTFGYGLASGSYNGQNGNKTVIVDTTLNSLNPSTQGYVNRSLKVYSAGAGISGTTTFANDLVTGKSGGDSCVGGTTPLDSLIVNATTAGVATSSYLRLQNRGGLTTLGNYRSNTFTSFDGTSIKLYNTSSGNTLNMIELDNLGTTSNSGSGIYFGSNTGTSNVFTRSFITNQGAYGGLSNGSALAFGYGSASGSSIEVMRMNLNGLGINTIYTPYPLTINFTNTNSSDTNLVRTTCMNINTLPTGKFQAGNNFGISQAYGVAFNGDPTNISVIGSHIFSYNGGSSTYACQTTIAGSAATRFSTTSSGAFNIANLGSGAVSATNGTLSSASDSTLKIPAGYIDSALTKVLALKPRYFYWNNKSGLDQSIRQLGFFAQEVQSSLDTCVVNTPKNGGYYGIYDRGLIAYVVKAFQEYVNKTDAKIEFLENRVLMIEQRLGTVSFNNEYLPSISK